MRRRVPRQQLLPHPVHRVASSPPRGTPRYLLASAPVLHWLRSNPGASTPVPICPLLRVSRRSGRRRGTARSPRSPIRRGRRRSRFRGRARGHRRVEMLLVSICIPSLKVIAPLRRSPHPVWTQVRPALHTTIQAWQSFSDIRPSRTPALGDLRGTTEGGVGVWRGVPYAEQPVGERRFLAPAPLQPWTGVRDALEHGPLPPQGKSFVGGGRDDPKVRDEACLTLTVWSPDTSGSLPVMVWIPGGAFVFGAGQFQLYNGSRLAANGNVVVVNVTYRIGVFGGFELSDLGDGFDDNLALRDQMAALRWIRENIAAFGGDPDRVTVFGESAGATSVLALLASPAADGLVPPCDRAESRAAADRRPRAAGEAGARVPAAARRERRRGQGAAAAATAPRCGHAAAQERRDHADAGLRADLRRRPAAEPSGRCGPRGHGGPGAADHRHQQPRGVDVRLDQAADAAHDHGVDRRLPRPGRPRRQGSGARRVPATTRAGARWSRSAPT